MNEDEKGAALAVLGEDTKRTAVERAHELTAWSDLTGHAIEVLPLETSADQAAAATLAREIRKAKQRADDAKRALLAPFDAVISEVTAVFKAARVEIDRLDARLRSRLAEADAERRRREAEAAREAARAAREAEEALQAAALASSSAAVAEAESKARVALDGVRESLAVTKAVAAEAPKGVHVRVSWEYEVEALDLVPRHLLTVDPKAIKAFLQATKGSEVPPAVPGIRWVKRETTVIR